MTSSSGSPVRPALLVGSHTHSLSGAGPLFGVDLPARGCAGPGLVGGALWLADTRRA